TKHKTLYFGDHITARIYRANYGGSAITPLLNATDLRHTAGIRVLESADKVYYTNGEFLEIGGFNGIRRADLDRANAKTLYDAGGVHLLCGYLAFDVRRRQMYFSETETGKIYRMALDGSKKTEFLTGIPHVLDMAIDSGAKKIYVISEF